MVMCDETGVKSTSAPGGVVGKLPSVGADVGATGVELPLYDVKTAVT